MIKEHNYNDGRKKSALCFGIGYHENHYRVKSIKKIREKQKKIKWEEQLYERNESVNADKISNSSEGD